MEQPNINDRLFVEADGTEHNYASINRSKGIRNEKGMFFIIEGYREASFHLLNELINNHKDDWLKIDSFIYPILFTFRHYLEVIIKDTTRYHRMIRREVYSDQVGFKNDHSLSKLWNELRPYLEATYRDSEDLEDKLTAIEKLLAEFDDKDKGSYSFRYPFESSRSIDADIQFALPHISLDLKNLQMIFQKLSYYFDSINEHALIILDDVTSIME